MFVQHKYSIIQIGHPFILFAQVIVAVVCMGIALVVCEKDEKPPKETTTEAPAETYEIPANNADDNIFEEATEEECLDICELQLKVCLEPCDSVVFSSICNARCIYLKYTCRGMCYMP